MVEVANYLFLFELSYYSDDMIAIDNRKLF